MGLLDKIKSLFKINQQKLIADENNYDGLTEELRYEKVLKALNVNPAFIRHPRTRESLFNILSKSLSNKAISKSKRKPTEVCLEFIKNLSASATGNSVIISNVLDENFDRIEYILNEDGTTNINDYTIDPMHIGLVEEENKHTYNEHGIEIKRKHIVRENIDMFSESNKSDSDLVRVRNCNYN